MIYRTVRLFGTFLLEVFFREIKRRGAPLCERGPVLIVANHPNFLFDPALLGRIYRRPLWFLAKSTLFANPFVAPLMQALHMVPVYRHQDNPADVGKNTEMFAKVAAGLLDGRAIAIFPEGVSLGLRRLSPMKTGAARIALQTESEANFSAGLCIQPIGITYADMREFQTSVTVYAGQPIEMRAYKQVYLTDPQEAVRILTQDIESALRSVTVEVENDEHRELVDLLGKLYSANGYAGDDRALLSGIAEHVAALAHQHVTLKTEILLKLRWYISLASALHLDPGQPRARRAVFFLTIAAPFILLGSLFHFVPYRLVGILVSGRTPAVETATMKLALGTGTFLLWYAGFALCLHWMTQSVLVAIACFVVALTSGYLALRYLHPLRAAIAGFLLPGTARARKQLEALSDELFALCEELRASHREE